MKETIISILAILCCLPILVWIFRAFVIEPYKEDIRIGRSKNHAIGSAALSGVIVVLVLLLIGMCYKPMDAERAERYDEYQQRREPGW